MPRPTVRLNILLLIYLFIAALMLSCWLAVTSVSAESNPSEQPNLSIFNQTSVGVCSQPPPVTTPILAIYVLAFDNDSTITNTYNLTLSYTDTVQSIANSTALNADVRAVILADLDDNNDTHILSVANGSVNSINCLPDTSGVLVDTTNELDTTDGATLGGYFVWAASTYPATSTVVSYIGHGTFFAPETGTPIADLVESNNSPRQTSQGALSPLPNRLRVNSFFTDKHVPGGSSDFIKPHDLAVALDRLTQGGEFPVDVLDLVHCFAASAEEFYELHEYADYTTGSPNYAWYGPDMPGEALSKFTAADTSEDLAADILIAYDSIIPTDGQHPSALIAVKNSEMAAVKTALDDVSAYLIEEFNADPTGTVNRIDSAYINSRKYDTTFCEDPADLELSPPDELSDIHSFFEQMGTEAFSQDTLGKITALFSAIETANGPTQRQKPGAPHFYEGMGAAPMWNFSEEPYYSIFTPFDVWTAEDGTTYHSWQSLWYTGTTVYEIDGSTTISNPHPFRLLQTSSGSATWADVIARYWREVAERPGIDVDTAFCGQPLRGFRQPLIRMELTIINDVDPVETGDTIFYKVGVANSGPTTATQIAIVHKLSPLTKFIESDAGCFLNGSALVCPIGTLLPSTTKFYTVAALALSPGSATIDAEISVFQTILPTTASQTTTINGTPLAVSIAQMATATALHPALVLLMLLTTLLTISFSYKRQKVHRLSE